MAEGLLPWDDTRALREEERVAPRVLQLRGIRMGSADQADLEMSERMGALEERLLKHFTHYNGSVRKLLTECQRLAYKEPENALRTARLNLQSRGLVSVDAPRERRERKGKVTLGDKRTVRFLTCHGQ